MKKDRQGESIEAAGRNVSHALEVSGINGQLSDLITFCESQELAFSGMLIVDSEDQVVWTNPGAERIFGYSVEEYAIDEHGLTGINKIIPGHFRDKHPTWTKRFWLSRQKVLIINQDANRSVAGRDKRGKPVHVQLYITKNESQNYAAVCIRLHPPTPEPIVIAGIPGQLGHLLTVITATPLRFVQTMFILGAAIVVLAMAVALWSPDAFHATVSRVAPKAPTVSIPTQPVFKRPTTGPAAPVTPANYKPLVIAQGRSNLLQRQLMQLASSDTISTVVTYLVDNRLHIVRLLRSAPSKARVPPQPVNAPPSWQDGCSVSNGTLVSCLRPINDTTDLVIEVWPNDKLPGFDSEKLRDMVEKVIPSIELTLRVRHPAAQGQHHNE